MDWRELADFLDSGVAMLGASAGADGFPEPFRLWGATVESEDRLRVLVNADACRTYERVATGTRLALLFTDITDFRSVQVKGSATGSPTAAGPDDMATYRRYDERFFVSLRAIGHPPSLRERLRPWSVFAVDVVVDAIFDQTPGANAGRRVSA